MELPSRNGNMDAGLGRTLCCAHERSLALQGPCSGGSKAMSWKAVCTPLLTARRIAYAPVSFWDPQQASWMKPVPACLFFVSHLVSQLREAGLTLRERGL